jgi:ATP-binding cassette subfamily C (CFTR/MRP) protein 1
MVLDLVGLALFIVALAMTFNGTVSLGFPRVALVNLETVTNNIKNLITAWKILETSIGAVSRIRGFEAETVSKNLPGEKYTPPADWPLSVEMDIRGLSKSLTSWSPICSPLALPFPPAPNRDS